MMDIQPSPGAGNTVILYVWSQLNMAVSAVFTLHFYDAYTYLPYVVNAGNFPQLSVVDGELVE